MDLISRARAGDGEAFRALTEPHRRELQVHCYRMLGSFQDAEDALQDTLLSAWRGLGGFDGLASLRTWLYRIATNRCLTTLRSTSRRPVKEWDIPGVEPPEPTRFGEVPWLEPLPDALLDGALNLPLGPEARFEQTESISLAFVTALQVLPPRQLAVLILRDVLGFHASEVADMLDTTVESVKSTLKRARASLRRRRSTGADREPPPAAGSSSEDAIVAKFVRAYESTDIDAVVALLTDDVFISMPPLPFEYEGRDLVGRFCAGLFDAGRRFRLVLTRANGQPAFGAYVRASDGTHHGAGLFVIALTGDRIDGIELHDRVWQDRRRRLGGQTSSLQVSAARATLTGPKKHLPRRLPIGSLRYESLTISATGVLVKLRSHQGKTFRFDSLPSLL
ncbi:RNA polymerase sigma-70 factor (ECF subfamily) [Actinophytocola oryzae]|uniref:RNA polymerase sigma-70 factor (ECF subfamily) n=1 Tax=Actinophytocola oryzae TaxID=502181 RepID=A0A4R7V470_9PSEU|nr:RNA polymerase sigma-70 factor (ECF subfamily) [Actinophytocola oryzae]